MKRPGFFALTRLAICFLIWITTRPAGRAACGQEPTPELTQGSAAADRQHLILVVGAAGLDEYRDQFTVWGLRWLHAAKRGQVEVTSIGIRDPADGNAAPEQPTPDREQLMSAIQRLAALPGPEPLWIVFIGHGTFDGRSARFNLEGADLSADELSAILQPAARPVAVLVCASCSAPFINTVSGPGRAVVSATKDANQIQFSRFGDYLSQAISGLESDTDRDGQTSLLEAWLYAARRTAEFYETDGRLATEHALLDDNADGKGSRSEFFDADSPEKNPGPPPEVDGSLAARWHLVRSADELQLTTEQRVVRDALERQILQLKQSRASLEEREYLRQLEALLIPLAQIYEAADTPATPVP
jgi:hypothetical protein